MAAETSPEAAIAHIASQLRRLGTPFALVGGLAVSVRAEVRFTRDVDLAVDVDEDPSVERLVRELATVGYRATALVEHEQRHRLSTVRLTSPSGVVVDLLAASSGVESEIVARAIVVPFDAAGLIPVARAEELLAMKVLSMTDKRLQDRIDAMSLVQSNPTLDLAAVRDVLHRITERGYHRDQDLLTKLETVLEAARAS